MRQKFLILSLILLGAQMNSVAHAGDWDSLGSSEALIEKAKAIDPDNRIRVVQRRAVDRNLRFEINGHGGLINGGDSYVKTTTAGAQVEFHINPRWSLGVRYDKYFSNLTAEGDRVFNESAKQIALGNPTTIPDINYPMSSQLATLSWYPIYGKLNLFDAAITQFDFYLLAGAGVMQLDSGHKTGLVSAGGGVGLWLSQYLSARLELRYQGYNDPIYSQDPKMNTMAMHFSVGLLL